MHRRLKAHIWNDHIDGLPSLLAIVTSTFLVAGCATCALAGKEWILRICDLSAQQHFLFDYIQLIYGWNLCLNVHIVS